MSRIRRHVFARRRMAGLSLIEMMIALVMALIVTAGIITVFQSTSSSNRVQSQLATLQEEGRFAIHSLRTDLADANGAYCSNSGGNASQTPSGRYLDSLRSPTMYVETNLTDTSVAGHFPDITVSLPDPAQAYSLPSSIFMRGYDCGMDSGSCTPVDPSANTSIPVLGTAPGDRVPGTSVLTMRYLKPGSGWAIVQTEAASGTKITQNGDGTVASIALDRLTNEDPVTDFTSSIAMLADCSNAQVFTVSNSGNTLTPTGANYAQPLDITKGAAPRVFDFVNDFQTITYYVKVVCVDGRATCPGGPTTGALVRRVNGREDIAGAGGLVRGVERLDFRYGIIDANGNVQYLTADEVDTAKDSEGNSIDCPPGVGTDGGMGNAGCLWRAVQTIQVNILMDGQTPLYTLTTPEMDYIYSPDCEADPLLCTTTPVLPPSSHVVKPDTDQGFPKQLLRREFTTVVALRNFNP